MKILVVSQYFWPENFRINDLCVELKRRGHDVTVLTGLPNYPEGQVFSEYKADPKKFNTLHGVKIIRVPIVSRGDGALRLLLNYLSYAVSASFFSFFKLRKCNFDIIFVCQLSPVFIALPAILLRGITKTPMVMWVLDLWPESLRSVGLIKSERALGILGRVVSYIYNRCDLILGQSPSFKKDISKYTLIGSRYGVLYSWAEDIFFLPAKKNEGGILKKSDENIFDIVFAGNIGEAQALDTSLIALSMAKNMGAKCRLHLVGDGRAISSLKSMVVDLELEKDVIFYGRMPLDNMPKLYSEADALFLSLKESPIFELTIPGKLQSYLAAGKPIIGAISGESMSIINSSESGLCSPAGNVELLAKNFLNMSKMPCFELNEMGDNGKFFFEDNFSKKIVVDGLEKDLDALLRKI